MKNYITLAIISCSLLSGGLCAQEKEQEKKNFIKSVFSTDTSGIERNLLINAEVLENDQVLEDAKVYLFDNNKLVKVAVTDSNGNFQHKLDFGTYYEFKFSRAGYVSKRLAVDTRDMPDEDKETGYDLGRFKMNLFRYVNGMDTSAYSVPVAKYAFDPLQRMFLVERKYTKKRQKDLSKVEESNQQILAEKKAEFEALDKEYELLIRDADIEFKNKDYELAKTYYRDALKIKPNEVYPKEQLQKIARLNASLEENKRRFDLLVLQADNAFKAENYSRAKEAYTSALDIFPEESYPQEQLDKIAEIKPKEKVAEKAKEKYPKEFKLSEDDKKKSSGFMSELAKKYPQGLTEEVSEDGSKKTIRRIIVDGNIGVEYKKVKHSWGGEFYFKNGEPTTEYVWLKETE